MKVLLPVYAALALSATPAIGAVTTYSSSAAFSAATTGVTTYGFTAPDNSYTSVGSSYNVGPATFDGGFNTSEFLYGANGLFSVAYLASINPINGGAAFTVNFTSGYSAVAFVLGAAGNALPVSVSVNGTPGFSMNTSTTGAFFGLTSDSGDITSVSFFAPGTGEVDALSVSAGQIAAAPEPATWTMLVGGFGMIGGALRARKRVRIAFV